MPHQVAASRARELSGITLSGSLTLGNYLGALRRFREHQDHGFYFVANLHALITTHDPDQLRELTRSTAALFFACGLDPDRATVFVQSDVTEHVRLSYLLECTAYVGELGRMIQFKEKGGRPRTRASLFTYPCLMAADILLYNTDQVPVGGDQSQHVELARDLAERFNATYGATFRVLRLAPAALTTRVRDLADLRSEDEQVGSPRRARRHSHARSPQGDPAQDPRAVTDSDTVLSYDPTGRPGIANIAEITAALSNRTPTDALDKCSGYGQLKNTCADAIIAELEPIQRRHDELLGDPAELDRVLTTQGLLGQLSRRNSHQAALVRQDHGLGAVSGTGLHQDP